MTPEHHAIWSRMPPEARDKATALSESAGIPLDGLVDLWAMAERNEQAAAARRNDPKWAEKAREAREQEQDASDANLVKGAMENKWGPAAKAAIEELTAKHDGNDARAFLRAARRVVVDCRWGKDRRAG